MAQVLARATSSSPLCMGGTPVVGITSREQLAAWLRKQPRDVCRILADRWTLRALPIVVMYQSDLLPDLVLPSFRVVAVSWASVEFPAYETGPAFAAAKAAGARAFTAAARAARATDAILEPGAADDTMIRAGFAFAARGFAAAAADDSEGRAFAAAAGAQAFAAFANAAAATAFWSAISADATQRENGMSAAEIAGLPLWPDGPPVELRSLWEDLKAKLLAAKQDWQVWTTWHDDRLAGRVREEERELAYVRLDESLWDQGPAVVNAEIKRLIESGTTSIPNGPVVSGPSIEKTAVASTPPRIAACSRPVFKGFFSYSHDDAKVDPNIVEAFSSELEGRVDANLVNASFKIWRDTRNLRAGDNWEESIMAEIGSVHILIVLLTPKWISSDYCRKEFNIFEKVESDRKSGGYTVPIYARDIEGQIKYLENEQRILYDRIKRIQHEQVIPGVFARLSAVERIELIEHVVDPICAMIERLRSK